MRGDRAQPVDKPRRPYRAGQRRIWSIDELPMPRAWMHGPRWQSHFGVTQRPIADVAPPWASRCRAGRKFVLVFTFEDEVRERVLEEIRPGVFAVGIAARAPRHRSAVMAATSTTPADDQPTTMTLYAGRPDVTPQHEVSAAIMFAKNELEVCNRGRNGCEKR